MPSGWASPLGRLLSRTGLGVLTCFIPPVLVDEALAVSGRDEQRFRALPSRLGIYLVLGLCLQRTKSAVAVVRSMIPIDMLTRLAELGWVLPSSTALTKLRDRLGVVPFQLLFTAMTRPVPTRVQPWSHAFGLQVCAWDGTEVTVATRPRTGTISAVTTAGPNSRSGSRRCGCWCCWPAAPVSSSAR